jgi:hypothetical protein
MPQRYEGWRGEGTFGNALGQHEVRVAIQQRLQRDKTSLGQYRVGSINRLGESSQQHIHDTGLASYCATTTISELGSNNRNQLCQLRDLCIFLCNSQLQLFDLPDNPREIYYNLVHWCHDWGMPMRVKRVAPQE